MHNNSGGILITDETGPDHDNLITGNTVTRNGYACGITLASHPAASLANPTTPFNFGVYHNTVSGNEVSFNGLLSGAGAGVGIYAPGPGSQTYGNMVIGNTLESNGLPGVAMHNHAAPPGAPAISFNDNSIIGNTIRFNAADTEDAATAGPTGINIYSLTPMTGTVIAQNQVDNEAIDLAVNVALAGSTGPAQIQAHLNNFVPYGFRPRIVGISNTGAAQVDGAENWWGCTSDPSQSSGLLRCAAVTSGVTTSPWLLQPAPAVTAAANPFLNRPQ